MKLPFRFFRGELNGFYLRRLLLCANIVAQEVIDELVYQASMTWDVGMRDDDMLGIGKIAGIFRPVVYGQTTNGGIRFTLSNIVSGVERSERGLWDTVKEMFVFIRTTYDEYSDDIVIEATSRYRSTFVPDGYPPIGYVAYGTDLYEEDGTVITENILATPPIDGTPYSTYYGDKFLTFADNFKLNMLLPLDIFKTYYEIVMRIRYDGSTIATFFELTELLGGDYITEVDIEQIDYYYVVHYTLNNASDAVDRLGLYAVWYLTTTQKFKSFILLENIV